MPFTTTLGVQKTPANPVDVILGPQLGLPNAINTVCLIGSMGATGGPTGGGTASGTSVPYTPVSMNNVSDVNAASGEAVTRFGAGSELTKMVIAAVKAITAGPNYPPITCIPLAPSDSSFGPSNAALTALDKLPVEFVATQYDWQDAVNRPLLNTEIAAMSGAQRTSNNQFGSFGVMVNNNVPALNISTLAQPNTQFMVGCYLYDSAGSPYSVGESAAACAAVMAANPVPFNGLDGVPVPGIPAPVNMNDWITVGGGLESETILNQGITPLRVLPNGQVAFVRTVTSRTTISASSVTPATAYFDVQDFQVLYYFRNAVATRFSQPDFQNQKASPATATAAKGEVVRLMQEFQDQTMFQSVSQLAQMVIVQTNPSQRGRFDVFIPVNVVPNLHEIATDIEATTLFDQFTA